MKTRYKKTIVECGTRDEPAQIYITEDWVDAERIHQGDDDGVLCLCMTDAAADTILEALNGGKA